ncbi:cilia- and flagella-associated protein 221 isoform X2 [Nelusetta ayraudi]|uniref:cilia- and flagella-associated protein 221 isoform X2 n=1 Tax=Nelusetta ayraudi TaxID=303726 RepID=UPI003F717789
MEVALSAQRMLSEPLRRGTSLPLTQLVEKTKARAGVPKGRPDSKVKQRSLSLIQTEPAELHFSGFQLQEEYTKTLKLINGSSQVLNIQVIPTQTDHFRTSCSRKCRLVPGLPYTLKVTFQPDEWRYFYDRIRVHCKEEENLIIPVHAYPVITDLHIPSRIDLPAVPLGQSVCHVIPLRCGCPVEFEFQVYIMEPDKAFSVHPLTGVIPAGGELQLRVTFTPVQYETSRITFQLIVSQFNTQPFLCTVTGCSAPHLALSELRRELTQEVAAPAEVKPTGSRSRLRPLKQADKSKTSRGQDVGSAPKPVADVWTPAGVAKMLIKDGNRISSKDLKEALSGSGVGVQDRQLREAIFLKKIQRHIKEEQAVYIKWQTRLGKDPVSPQTRRKITEEREFALHEYRVKVGDAAPQEDSAAGPPELLSQRLIHEAGQTCEGAPTFQFYPAFHWQLRRRVLTLFQQAARKVVVQCRADQRLACLRKLAGGRKSGHSASKAKKEDTDVLEISADRVFPFAIPLFPDSDELLTPISLRPLPVEPVKVAVTTKVPILKLQVPQRYNLMGYQPVLVWDAFNSYIPPTLARPLWAAPLDEPASDEDQSPQTAPPGALEEEAASLPLTAAASKPRGSLNPTPRLPSTEVNLESDKEVPLCPQPSCTTPEANTDRNTPLSPGVLHFGVFPWVFKATARFVFHINRVISIFPFYCLTL